MGHGEGHGQGSGAYKGKMERFYLPAMPMPIAVMCCVLNFILPGIGRSRYLYSIYWLIQSFKIDWYNQQKTCL